MAEHKSRGAAIWFCPELHVLSFPLPGQERLEAEHVLRATEFISFCQQKQVGRFLIFHQQEYISPLLLDDAGN